MVVVVEGNIKKNVVVLAEENSLNVVVEKKVEGRVSVGSM